jgi:parvulin-like peptidyl-prolyl isomerase
VKTGSEYWGLWGSGMRFRFVVFCIVFFCVVVQFSYSSELARIGKRSITVKDVFDELPDPIVNQYLDRVLSRMLVLEELKRQNLEVTALELENEYNKKVEEVKAKAGKDFDMRVYLRKTYGATVRQYKEGVLKFDLALRKLVKKEIGASDSDYFNFYFQRREKYSIPEQVRISHILISPRQMAKAAKGAGMEMMAIGTDQWRGALKQALGVKDMLRDGRSFAELADKYSADTRSAKKGGDVGFIKRGRINKAVEDVAFALENGEVSEPVKTMMGYHIIKRTDHIKGRLLSYSSVKDRVRKDYLEYMKLTSYKDFVYMLKERSVKSGHLKLYQWK